LSSSQSAWENAEVQHEWQDLASRDARPDYDPPVAERDIVRETAELNAHVLELVQWLRAAPAKRSTAATSRS
jgi:hypothetical protein